MSTSELQRSRWFMPLVSLFLGAVMFVAFVIGGNIVQGAVSFGVIAVLGAVFAFARRSETIQGIGGPARDERWDMIDLRATAFAGVVVIVAVLIAFVVEVARGHDAAPFALLGAIGGVAYVAVIAWFRARG